MKDEKKYDLMTNLMAYENGDLDVFGSVELFSHLIRHGLAWSLQGAYGRVADSLILQGFLTEHGEITDIGYGLEPPIDDKPKAWWE